MSEYNVRAGDNDSSYGTFSTLEAAERALRMVQRHDPEARIVVKYDWQARALMAEAAIRRVGELHIPYSIMMGLIPTDTNCEGCNRVYPCPTMRALDGERDD